MKQKLKENQKEKRTIKFGVQLKLGALFFAFIALLIIFLNTYPLIATRDLVFSSKRDALQSQASLAAASLSALDVLEEDGVRQVMELLDISGLTRVAIAAQDGTLLYDACDADAAPDRGAEREIARALSGEAVFHAWFSEGVFFSHAVQPVRSRGMTIGAVYLYEYDREQGELLLNLQSTLRSISLIVGAMALLLLMAFTHALTGRMTDLVRAIRIVRDGSYDYRLKTRGHDEITELGEEFNNMTAQLQQTEELRRRFVSDASHELKTPLASIRLLSDSIAQSGNMDAETMREFVSDIGTEAERLQRTTDKLLGLTRLDATPKDVPRKRLDVARVAEDTLRLLRPLAEQQHITLRPLLKKDCFIMGSADDLYQIIFNLVENAIKYNCPDGLVDLVVGKRGGEVYICVEDTGIGIPQDDLPHIFSRFYRVDKARSRASGGSGLGLSIVRDAVLLHGGSVTAERRDGGGSRFVVVFPAAQGTMDE